MTFSQLIPDNCQRSGESARLLVEITEMRLRDLRAAVQGNRISFPSQIPLFARQSRADVQWRVAGLYFVQNWSCADLAKRYGVTTGRIRQLLSQWAKRAAVLGYLQEIPATANAAPGLAAGVLMSAVPLEIANETSQGAVAV